MNIVIDIDEFNKDYIFLQEPVKNNIIDDSKFIRIIYSNNIFSINTLYIVFNLHIIQLENYFNKHKFIFNVKQNTKAINQLKSIEEAILDKIFINNKKPVFRLYEQLNSGNLKLFKDNLKLHKINSDNEFIIKISGIWDNEYEYGITYKFVDMTQMTH
jgi:hypothetical protein